MNRKPLFDELSRVLVEWTAARMMESDAVREIMAAYADNHVEALTGHPAEDWRTCRVKAVEVK